MLQGNSQRYYSVFDIAHYKTLKKYLTILGLDPYQDARISNILVITVLLVYATVFIPATIKFYNALQDKDYDGIFEDLPQLISGTIAILKLLNIRSNKIQFKKLFDFVIKGWWQLEGKDDLNVLNNLMKQGSEIALVYRRTLIVCVAVFLSIPLYNPFMDIILPLNETRPRQHIFKVNYVVIDEFEYFYSVYVHLSCIALIVLLLIISVDSLYIIIIHHACGLFAVCGYQVLKATENNIAEKNGATLDENGYREFKECVMMHHQALQFYQILDNCCRNSYLIQMGLNMIVISITAVEIVLFLGRPEEAIRTGGLLAGQQFHLYMISLPGQILIDESSGLADKIYASRWYKTPVKVQKLLYLMQIRCTKPSILTAAGLYEMKIESFGITVKTCVSYFTMFLSLKD